MHKITKQDRVPTEDAFRLHCFPELSMGCGSGSAHAPDKGYGFEQVESGPLLLHDLRVAGCFATDREHRTSHQDGQ